MRLIDCFAKVLAYTVILEREHPSLMPTLEDVRADYDNLLAEADEAGRRGGFPLEDYQAAKFAVCAFVDEAILISDWDGRTGWMPLQRLFFRTTNAGEEFFQRLETVPETNKSVREVYAVCLSLGFTGRYFDPQRQEEFEGLTEANLRLVLGEPAEEEGPSEPEDFLPGAYPEGAGAHRIRLWGRLSPWTVLLLLLPPALFLTLFALYRFLLGRVVFDFFT
ncbi:MAG: DotU family type IV/VI secretion system protein [Thermodesulfobacteriota bacterium]